MFWSTQTKLKGLTPANGISPNFLVPKNFYRTAIDLNLDIPTVNSQMSLGLYKNKAKRKEVSPLVDFLYSNYGPIWYRGLVMQEEKYKPLSSDSLNLILKKYGISKIIVGHTIFKDIRRFYDGRVIAVNVDNEKNRKKKRGRAILIEKHTIYVIGDKDRIRMIK